jgi:hypothetical protein
MGGHDLSIAFQSGHRRNSVEIAIVMNKRQLVLNSCLGNDEICGFSDGDSLLPTL